MIDYKALAGRIQQAIDAQPLTVPEVAMIDKADLRTVVSLLEGMADAPEGWQLVPKESTQAMNNAGLSAVNQYGKRLVWKTYRAMLAAAPHPAPQPQLMQRDDEMMSPEAARAVRDRWHELYENGDSQPQPERQPVSEPTRWKVGNELAPYHPDASHVEPGYRDGWNACYRAMRESEPTDAQIEPMSLAVALDFADNPRPYHTLQAPADTNGELYRALRVLAAAYRAALAAEQPEPTEDDDTDRTIEEIADFFNEHGAEANEPADAQIEAAADVTHDDFDALVDSYTRAAPEFDANVLRDFLSRYPQHANKLLFYAARQLNSTPATPEEVEREEVSNEELLRMQSKVLKLLGKARLAATHFCKDCGALWRQRDDYSFSLHLSTRACPRCELESNATQLLSLRDERERLRAVAEAHGSALQRAGTAVGLPAGADLHRDLVPAIESLRRWAGKAAYAAAIKACEAHAEHEEEARALQRADAARGGDEKEELARLRHLSDVRLYNAGIRKCADAIRSLMQEQPK